MKRIAILILGLTFMACLMPGAKAFTQSQLLINYTFEDGSGTTVTDNSLFSHTGFFNKYANPTWLAVPKYGAYSLYFNTTHLNVMSALDHADFDSIANGSTNGNSFTVSVWLNTSATGLYQYAFDKGNGSANAEEWGAYINSTNYFTVRYRDTTPTYATCTDTTAVAANTWYHFTAMFNETHVNVYRNGLLTKQCALTKSVARWNGNITIGHECSITATQGIQGVIDDFRLWNTTLNSSEIYNNYMNNLSATDLPAGDTTPPSISWNTPATNNTYTQNQSWIYWNVTVSEAPNACLLNINSSQNYSMTISGSYCSYNLTGLANSTTQKAIVYANDSSGNLNRTIGEWWAIVNLTSGPDVSPPSVSLVTPATGNFTEQQGAITYISNMNCTATDNINLSNSTLYGNWSGGWHINQTLGMSGVYAQAVYSKSFPTGTYLWNCYVCDNSSNCAWAAANYTFTVRDTTAPQSKWQMQNRTTMTDLQQALLSAAGFDIANLHSAILSYNSTTTATEPPPANTTNQWIKSASNPIMVPATAPASGGDYDWDWMCFQADDTAYSVCPYNPYNINGITRVIRYANTTNFESYKRNSDTTSYMIPIGAGGTWDDAGTDDPNGLYINSTSPYTGCGTGMITLLAYGGNDGSNTRTGLACSNKTQANMNLANAFTKIPYNKCGTTTGNGCIVNITGAGTISSTHIYAPKMIQWNSTTVRMFLTASNGTSPWHYCITYADSLISDLVNWTLNTKCILPGVSGEEFTNPEAFNYMNGSAINVNGQLWLVAMGFTGTSQNGAWFFNCTWTGTGSDCNDAADFQSQGEQMGIGSPNTVYDGLHTYSWTPYSYNSSQNRAIYTGADVSFSSSGLSGVNLATQEKTLVGSTTTWVNTSLYLNSAGTWSYSNFTFLGSTFTAPYTVNWTVYYNDSTGNSNQTSYLSFDVTTADTIPPSPQFVSPTLANQSYTQNQSWIFINVSASEDLNSCLLDIYPNAANTTITTSDAYEIRYDQLSTYATDTEHGDVGRLSGSPPTYTRTIVPFPTAGITANVTQANLSFTIDSDGFPVFGNGFTLSIFYNISFNYNDTYCRANASTKGQCWNITDMPGTWIGNITIGADNSTYSMDMTSAFNNDHSDGLLNVWFKSDRENQSILTDAVTIIVDTLEVGHIWPSVYYYPLSYQNISMTLAASSRSAYYNATDLVNATAYYFRAWCNDTSGNLNKTEDRQITINLTGADTTPPDISWNTPSVNNTATANTTLLGFNVTVSETGGSAILNINGTTNYTMNWAGNYAYYTFNGANQTTYCGRVYANDTSGNLNLSTSSRCITVNLYSGGGDITPPTITITSPGNTSYKNASIKIDFYIYPDDLGFSVTGYCLNENYYTCSNPEPGGPLDCNRVLGSNCSGNICWVCSSPYFTAPQGQNFLDFLTSDNVGNYNQTRIYFTVDSIHPSPQFVSPTLSNNSYTSNVTWIYVNVSAGEALNSCTLDWNGANQTMTLGGNYCYKNMTSLTNGTAYYFRVFANDTIGNMNVTEWRKITVRLLDFVTSYVQTQTADVIEQTSHAFTLNFTTTETATVLASLVYDGTTYSASRTVLDANSTYFTASVTSPIVSSTSENKDWHWAVTINGAGLDTATEQQTVYKMILTNCSAGSESTTKALWYYLKDEESGSPIAGTFAVTYDISTGGSFERSYPFNFTGQDNYSVCIYPAWASYYADAIGAYNSSGYLQRSYYLTNHPISNTTESVNLLLSSASSTLVTITVVDTVANPQEGIDIIVQRYYPDTGIYEQVYSLRTGADGKTIAYMIPYDVWYKFILSKDGTILRTVNPMVITSSTLTLTIDYPTYGNPYEYRGGVASSCAWNSTTSVLSCIVVDTTGKMTNACLNVSKYGAVGMEDEFEVCSDSNSSTLIWTGGNASQFMYPYEVKAYFPDTNILVDNGVIGSKHELYDTMGDYAIIIALIIVFVVAFLSITANPVIPIVMSCVAMIAGFALGVLPIGLSGLASIIVAGAVIILKMRT